MADSDAKRYICSETSCHKSFARPGRLRQHMLIHTGERPFKCTLEKCDKTYTRQAYLTRHQETAHSKAGEVTEERTEKKKEISCTYEECTLVYQSNAALKKHIERVHVNKVYKCTHEGCNERFHKKCQLRKHKQSHLGHEPFTCDHEGCHMKFPSSKHLQRHKKRHEGYRCSKDGCDRVFDVWTLLRKHMAMDHVTEFTCKDCGKVFHGQRKYRLHCRLHQDYREMIECPTEGCGRAYSKVANLKAHIRIFHEGHRFPCITEGCELTFSSKQRMEKHQTMHDPNRPPPKPRKKPSQRVSLAARLSLLPDKVGKSMRLVYNPNSETVSFVSKGEQPSTSKSSEPAPNEKESSAGVNVDGDDGTEEENEEDSNIESEDSEELDTDAYDSEIEKEAFLFTDDWRIKPKRRTVKHDELSESEKEEESCTMAETGESDEGMQKKQLNDLNNEERVKNLHENRENSQSLKDSENMNNIKSHVATEEEKERSCEVPGNPQKPVSETRVDGDREDFPMSKDGSSTHEPEENIGNKDPCNHDEDNDSSDGDSVIDVGTDIIEMLNDEHDSISNALAAEMGMDISDSDSQDGDIQSTFSDDSSDHNSEMEENGSSRETSANPQQPVKDNCEKIQSVKDGPRIQETQKNVDAEYLCNDENNDSSDGDIAIDPETTEMSNDEQEDRISDSESQDSIQSTDCAAFSDGSTDHNSETEENGQSNGQSLHTIAETLGDKHKPYDPKALRNASFTIGELQTDCSNKIYVLLSPDDAKISNNSQDE